LFSYRAIKKSLVYFIFMSFFLVSVVLWPAPVSNALMKVRA
jgi:hypothetical protein